MRQLGIGIVGCGGAALDVCRAIDTTPDLRLAAAHDRNPAYATDLAGPRGGTVHGTLADLLADPAVDFVYIALPHDLLAATAELSLAARRHVLVEKPMALDDEEARRLGRLAEARKLRLGVFFQQRQAGTVTAARRLVAGGAIGDVRTARIATIADKPSSYWQSGWSGRVVDSWRTRRHRAGGGVVLMNGIHQLDAFRYITGLAFVAARAETATLSSDVEVEDAASATLRLSNGGLANLAANANSPGARHEERIEIDGANGRVDLPDPSSGAPVRLYLRRPWQDHPAGVWIEIPTPTRDSHVETVRAFAEAVRAGAEPPAGAADAAAALATVLAIYESARTGLTVVPRTWPETSVGRW